MGRHRSGFTHVFLDRDGVINLESAAYIKSPNEWHAIPGSLEAIAALCAAGLRVSVVTNQSGIGRGYYNLATLDAIHQKMHTELATAGGQFTDVLFCPHHPDDGCACRKPKPGMLQTLLQRHHLSAENVCMIGDSARDYGAAAALDITFKLVETGHGATTILPNVARYPDLAHCVTALLV